MDFQSTFTNRLKTFNKNWTHKGNLSAKNMVKAGYYYSGKGDGVICYYCEKELVGWEEDDDPFTEHKSHQSTCPYVLMFSSPPHVITVREAFVLEVEKLKFRETKKHAELMKQLNMTQENFELQLIPEH